jgi:hypothetical protein
MPKFGKNAVLQVLGGGAAGAPLSASSLFFSGLPNVALVPQTMTPTGGTLPYGFVGAGLPAGVVIGAASGIISGTPTASGNTTATITVTDAAGTIINVSVFFVIAVATFSDNLQPPDQPHFIGNSWVTSQLDGGINDNAASLATRMNRVGSGLNLACNGGGSSIYQAVMFPMALAWDQIVTKSIAVQATLVSDTSTGGGGAANGVLAGLLAFCSPNSVNGYFCQRNFVTLNKVRVYRDVITQTQITNDFTLNANDVLRMEVRAAPTQNEITLLINGVVQQVAIDNNAARPTTGISGMSWFGAFVGAAVQVWKDFSLTTL